MIVRHELEAPNGPIQRREVHGSHMDQHLLPRPLLNIGMRYPLKISLLLFRFKF